MGNHVKPKLSYTRVDPIGFRCETLLAGLQFAARRTEEVAEIIAAAPNMRNLERAMKPLEDDLWKLFPGRRPDHVLTRQLAWGALLAVAGHFAIERSESGAFTPFHATIQGQHHLIRCILRCHDAHRRYLFGQHVDDDPIQTVLTRTLVGVLATARVARAFHLTDPSLDQVFLTHPSADGKLKVDLLVRPRKQPWYAIQVKAARRNWWKQLGDRTRRMKQEELTFLKGFKRFARPYRDADLRAVFFYVNVADFHDGILDAPHVLNSVKRLVQSVASNH